MQLVALSLCVQQSPTAGAIDITKLVELEHDKIDVVRYFHVDDEDGDDADYKMH